MDLRLDGYVVKRALLDDMQVMRELLVHVAKEAEMTVLLLSGVSFKEMTGDPEAGVSLVAIIAESHIAIHTWPETGKIMFRLVSCKPFNRRKIRRLVQRELGVVA